MNKKKPWYLSKTIWGAVIGMVGAVVANNKIDVQLPANADAETIKSIYKQVADNKSGVAGLLPVAIAVIGFGLSVYGRITADTQITATAEQ